MANELLQNLEKLHTTELGVVRIKQNLGLKTDGCTITVNAYSYTVITAHKEEENKNNTTHKKSAGKR